MGGWEEDALSQPPMQHMRQQDNDAQPLVYTGPSLGLRAVCMRLPLYSKSRLHYLWPAFAGLILSSRPYIEAFHQLIIRSSLLNAQSDSMKSFARLLPYIIEMSGAGQMQLHSGNRVFPDSNKRCFLLFIAFHRAGILPAFIR